MPPAQGATEPVVVGAIEVSDEDGAKTGLDKLAGCGSSGVADFGLAFTGGYAIVAETQAAGRPVRRRGELELAGRRRGLQERHGLAGRPRCRHRLGGHRRCARPVHRADPGRRGLAVRPGLPQVVVPACGGHVPLRERPRRAGQHGLRRHSGHRPRGQPDRQPAGHDRVRGVRGRRRRAARAELGHDHAGGRASRAPTSSRRSRSSRTRPAWPSPTTSRLCSATTCCSLSTRPASPPRR